MRRKLWLLLARRGGSVNRIIEPMARHGGTVNKDRTIEPRARHSGTVNRTIEPQQAAKTGAAQPVDEDTQKPSSERPVNTQRRQDMAGR